MRALLACTAVALALASCGREDASPEPGGVTVGEARALDEAAEMLDERRGPDVPPPGSDKAVKAPPGREE